ncbi:MAG TPA: preprotein translocase subunit YajC [Actinomycetota bacterium]|nr:preprotein translocase subunit YajC [Actinomycetota bacterium]
MSSYSGLVFTVLILVMAYMVLIRPQQRRLKQHQSLVSSIGVGDEVVTIGGMFGTVHQLDDTTVTLEVAPQVRIKFSRQAISRRVEHEAASETEDPRGDIE